MSRVELLRKHELPLLAQGYANEEGVDPLVALLSQVPELLEPTIAFVEATFGPSQVPPRTKEIVILRTSALLGCQYCVRLHLLAGLDSGLTKAQVLQLRTAPPGTEQWLAFEDAADRGLLGWVDALVDGRGPVDDERFADVREHFAPHEIVELTVLAGTTMMLNRLCTSLQLPTAPETIARLVAESLEGECR